MNERESEAKRLRGYEPILPDPKHPVSGVLLRDEIARLSQKPFRMIDPFREELLKPAAYHLTVGPKASVGGAERDLAEFDTVRIGPFNVAVIQTEETLNIPLFVVARWNIKVSLAYKGLMWVGGPQVDPGWVGRLACPVYNLSSEPVDLARGAPLAVMDFVVTSAYNKALWEERGWNYNREPKRILFSEYSPKTLRSGVAEQLSKADETTEAIAGRTEAEIASLERKVDNTVAWGIAAIALLVAALAVMSAWGKGKAPSVWPMFAGAALAASLAAVTISLAWRRPARSARPAAGWLSPLFAAVALAVSIAAIAISMRWWRP